MLTNSSLSTPLPRRRLHGCACTSPLAHFFIYHSDSSIRELHPFTTITHLASQNTITHYTNDCIEIQFLFRKRGATSSVSITAPAPVAFVPSFFNLVRKWGQKKHRAQWTEKLAGFSNEPETLKGSDLTSVESSEDSLPTYSQAVPVALRLEGPYFTTADPSRFNTVVCIVAGTGLSGALAIVGAFKELERQSALLTMPGETYYRPKCTVGYPAKKQPKAENGRADSIISFRKDRVWTRCVVLWSVREENFIELAGLEGKFSG